MRTLNFTTIALVATFAASPAAAGMLGVPGPVAGVGIGALAVLGLGYRALRNRMNK